MYISLKDAQHARRFDGVEPTGEYGSPFYEDPRCPILQFGDWFYFRHLWQPAEFNGSIFLSRPILAIFLGHTVWDQALVVTFVEVLRGRTKLLNQEPDTESIAIWSDNIVLLGHWKSRPTFRQIREAGRSK